MATGFVLYLSKAYVYALRNLEWCGPIRTKVSNTKKAMLLGRFV